MSYQEPIANYGLKIRPIVIWMGLLIAAIIQFGCANESVPQGGKKDEMPPKVKGISPQNKALHFTSDKIRITFNEYLKETGFGQTVISPPLEKQPVVHVSGKTITVNLKGKLRDSTTYTINFADDIKDLNEGNTANNFTYVFSTGDYIDSQKISGKVLLAKDNFPQEGIVVSLYPADSVNGILHSKPLYFAKTDKAGLFKFENIKANRYQIFGLKDANYNYLYDQPNELIAFSDSILDLTDSTSKPQDLYAFEDDKRKLTLNNSKSISPGFLQFYYNRPIKTFHLDAGFYTEGDFAYLNDSKDTINYWYSKAYTKFDSMFLTADDSQFDTLRMELHFIELDSLLKSSHYSLDIVNQGTVSKMDTNKRTNSNIQELYRALKINFTRPISRINEEKKLQIIEDSTTKIVNPTFVLDQKTKQSILVEFDRKENTHYTLQIPDSMFQGFLGTWNKEINYQFTTNGKTSYGNLHIALKTEHPEKYYIIRLLNANNELVKEFYFTGNGERKVSVDNILAGNYKFMVIDDENKNGEWDTGDFKNKRQAERIYTYKDNYQLKGGWDLDVEVKF